MNFDRAFEIIIGHEGGYVNDPLATALKSAIQAEKQKAASVVPEPSNARSYGCSVEGCDRTAYASGMCNAHYIRNRSGKKMTEPIRSRKRLDRCEQCGEKTKNKGGWGLCQKHYRAKRYRVIKDALIEAMGGACNNCGGKFHRSVYDFHHKHGKTDSPANILVNKSIEQIAKEISKCVLLCANCHRMEHNNEF